MVKPKLRKRRVRMSAAKTRQQQAQREPQGAPQRTSILQVIKKKLANIGRKKRRHGEKQQEGTELGLVSQEKEEPQPPKPQLTIRQRLAERSTARKDKKIASQKEKQTQQHKAISGAVNTAKEALPQTDLTTSYEKKEATIKAMGSTLKALPKEVAQRKFLEQQTEKMGKAYVDAMKNKDPKYVEKGRQKVIKAYEKEKQDTQKNINKLYSPLQKKRDDLKKKAEAIQGITQKLKGIDDEIGAQRLKLAEAEKKLEEARALEGSLVKPKFLEFRKKRNIAKAKKLVNVKNAAEAAKKDQAKLQNLQKKRTVLLASVPQMQKELKQAKESFEKQKEFFDNGIGAINKRLNTRLDEVTRIKGNIAKEAAAAGKIQKAWRDKQSRKTATAESQPQPSAVAAEAPAKPKKIQTSLQEYYDKHRDIIREIKAAPQELTAEVAKRRFLEQEEKEMGKGYIDIMQNDPNYLTDGGKKVIAAYEKEAQKTEQSINQLYNELQNSRNDLDKKANARQGISGKIEDIDKQIEKQKKSLEAAKTSLETTQKSKEEIGKGKEAKFYEIGKKREFAKAKSQFNVKGATQKMNEEQAKLQKLEDQKVALSKEFRDAGKELEQAQESFKHRTRAFEVGIQKVEQQLSQNSKEIQEMTQKIGAEAAAPPAIEPAAPVQPKTPAKQEAPPLAKSGTTLEQIAQEKNTEVQKLNPQEVASTLAAGANVLTPVGNGYESKGPGRDFKLENKGNGFEITGYNEKTNCVITIPGQDGKCDIVEIQNGQIMHVLDGGGGLSPAYKAQLKGLEEAAKSQEQQQPAPAAQTPSKPEQKGLFHRTTGREFSSTPLGRLFGRTETKITEQKPVAPSSTPGKGPGQQGPSVGP